MELPYQSIFPQSRELSTAFQHLLDSATQGFIGLYSLTRKVGVMYALGEGLRQEQYLFAVTTGFISAAMLQKTAFTSFT